MTTYETDSQGKFIPSTQRPDGTWRKPRRVRDGYVPQEEVPLYESKGKLFAQKPLLPPGMTPEMAQKSREKREREQRIRQQREAEANRRPPQNPVPGLLILNGDSKLNQQRSKPANAKPKKKAIELPDVLLEQKQKEDHKQARKQQQQQQQQQSQQTHKNPKAQQQQQQQRIEEVTKAVNGLQLTTTANNGGDGQTDLSKKLRKLRKKIREIELIEERLQSNDGPRPDKDQIDKAKRKPDILKEIEELEKGISK